jgi:riboflavin-specific deaminase-like protein
VDVTRLFPDPGPASADALMADLRLHERAHDDRPYVVLNMVESLDGRATIGGSVGELTSDVDQRILYGLRAQTDALLVGAGTVRNEGYGGLFPDLPEGDPQPIVAIVSGRVDLPPDLALLGESGARIVLATSHPDATLGFDHAASVDYLRVPAAGGRADTASILAALRRDHGVRSIVCEGGPTLNEALLGAGLVDELFLSLSPLVVGGNERTLADDAAAAGSPRRARLLSAATADDYLFLRYAL